MGEMRRKPMDEGALDDAIRRLVHEAGSDAPDAPPVASGMALTNPTSTRRPRWRAHAVAAAAAAVVVVGLVIVASGGDDDVAGPADETANPPSVVSTSPSVSSTASPPTTTAASRPVGVRLGSSCVEEYSLETLAGRTWGFDGTVRAIAGLSEGAFDTAVSFEVHEWFGIDGPPTVTVDMVAPQVISSAETADYAVGSRLLVTGEPRWGGDPLDAPVAWACGFTRTWDEPTAAAWRTAFVTRTPAEPPTSWTRPIADPDVCTSRSAREASVDGVTLFARPAASPVLIQIIADPARGPAGPFAVLQRFFGRATGGEGTETFEIDGISYRLAVYDNGNGTVEWEVVDGSIGYVRSRGLDRDDLLAIVSALTPRLSDAVMPGFDVDSDALPPPLGLLHEQLNTEVSGLVSESTCDVPSKQLGYRISALSGDPVFEYGGVIDRRVPLEVGIVDGTVVVISGPDDPAGPTVADVVEADPATWDELLSVGP